jgi:hypothetical protein
VVEYSSHQKRLRVQVQPLLLTPEEKMAKDTQSFGQQQQHSGRTLISSKQGSSPATAADTRRENALHFSGKLKLDK